MEKVKTTRDARKIQPHKARVGPVSNGMEKGDRIWNATAGTLSVAFSQKIGGSKSKQDKGGMLDEPGNHPKTAAGKGLPPFEKVLRF